MDSTEEVFSNWASLPLELFAESFFRSVGRNIRVRDDRRDFWNLALVSRTFEQNCRRLSALEFTWKQRAKCIELCGWNRLLIGSFGPLPPDAFPLGHRMLEEGPFHRFLRHKGYAFQDARSKTLFRELASMDDLNLGRLWVAPDFFLKALVELGSPEACHIWLQAFPKSLTSKARKIACQRGDFVKFAILATPSRPGTSFDPTLSRIRAPTLEEDENQRHFLEVRLEDDGVRHAAKFGQIDFVLQAIDLFSDDTRRRESLLKEALLGATAGGHVTLLETVFPLWRAIVPSRTTAAKLLDRLSGQDDMDRSITDPEFSLRSQAIHTAVECDSFDSFVWWIERGGVRLRKRYVGLAGKHARLDILNWIHDEKKFKHPELAACQAARHASLAIFETEFRGTVAQRILVLDWAWKRGVRRTRWILFWACMSGQIELVRWCADKGVSIKTAQKVSHDLARQTRCEPIPPEISSLLDRLAKGTHKVE